MRVRILGLAGCVAAVLAWASSARAETVRLSWQGLAGCPDAGRFQAEVMARTPNAQFSDKTTGQGRSFGVKLAEADHYFVGTLEIHEVAGVTNTRSFDGDTCGEVVSALALLTALAIDPNASSAPVAELPAVPPPRPSAPQPASPAQSAPSAQPLPPPPPSRPADAVAAPWHAAAGVHVSATGWVAPGAMPGLDLFGETWQERKSPITAGFRLGLGMDLYSTHAARWKWYTAKLEVCPLRAPVGWKLSVQVCGGADVGAVQGEGTDVIAAPHAQTRPWVAAGAKAGLLLESGRLFAGLDGGFSVPITRYRFYFDNPYTELHQVPAAGMAFAFGVGARFF